MSAALTPSENEDPESHDWVAWRPARRTAWLVLTILVYVAWIGFLLWMALR